jgi:DNA-binding response OmpR family regulator
MLKRVLILDDDRATLDAMQEVLSYAGFEVITTDTADDINSLITEFKPNIILVDYLLHGSVNGGEVCQQLKANLSTSHIPVIIISAYSRTIIKSLGHCGCDNFLAKPFDLSDLIDTLNKTIGFYLNVAHTVALPNIYK